MKTKKNILIALTAILFWIAVWWILSVIVGEELLLPSPHDTIKALMRIGGKPTFWSAVGMSFFRILSGILVAVLLGAISGILSGCFPVFEKVLAPLLSVIKSTPVVSFIVLINLWLKRDAVPVIISILIVFPVVCANLSEGIRRVDKKLLEVAKVHKFSFPCKLRRVYFPSVLPYFLSSIRSSLGMAWKAGIAAEVIVLPAISLGREIWRANDRLETAETFALTLTVILLSVLVDTVVSVLIRTGSERRTTVQAKEGQA